MLEDLRKLFDETMAEYKTAKDRTDIAKLYGKLSGIAKCAQMIYGVDRMIDAIEALHKEKSNENQ